jgi:hypothetical protein
VFGVLCPPWADIIIFKQGETDLNVSELKAGYKAFQEHEVRDAMYKIATFLVKTFWGKPREMSDGLGVLLLTWNQAFYRYGLFDFNALENCITRNQQILDAFRNRDILSYSSADDEKIKCLYSQFLESLQIAGGKLQGRQSPVAVAKALHLLAPEFFPLWDDKIAKAYKCHYKYIPFIQEMRLLAQVLAPDVNTQSMGKTLLKLIDEYNYAKFTKKWI